MELKDLELSYSIIKRQNALGRIINVMIPALAGVLLVIGQWIGFVLFMVCVLFDIKIHLTLDNVKAVRRNKGRDYIQKLIKEHYE